MTHSLYPKRIHTYVSYSMDKKLKELAKKKEMSKAELFRSMINYYLYVLDGTIPDIGIKYP